MNDCENCQRSLAGSDVTDAWEDGSNAQAFVICRHCRHKNILWGYGGGDD